MTSVDLDLGAYRLGWRDEIEYALEPRKGLDESVIRDISAMKREPQWMLDFRLKAYQRFLRKPIPQWGGGGLLNTIDFDDIYYYVKPAGEQQKEWDMVPDSIKATYEKLGIPEAERKYLAGVTAMYDSETVYHRNREDLEKLGVLFCDMDTALRDYPDLVKEYFGTIIPPNDNKFAALNSAVWSGGCLTADARINVQGRGLVSIGDVREGDEVYGVGIDGNLQRSKVVAHVESGVKDVFRVQVAGRTLEATGNHQFLVARRVANGDRGAWRAVWVPLDEIEVGEPIAVSKVLPDDGQPAMLPRPAPYIRNHHRAALRFPERSTTELCWLLGLWLSDGHTAAPHEHMRQISFSVPVTDPVHDEAIRVLAEVFNVRHVTPVACGFVASSKELGMWLADLGFKGHAKTKRLPDWVFGLPHDQQLALLGGVIDGDGWAERDGRSLCIELANRELLEDLRQLAISCGLYADGQLTERTRTVTFADRHSVRSTSWRLRIQGDLSRVGTRDPRKAGQPATKGRASRYNVVTGLNFSSLASATVGFARLTGKKPVGAKPTYDIQVLDAENFVANGIVAHNSFIYVPPGVHVDQPLQAYFRINSENMGQFERTLIVISEGAFAHYIEGCSAPVYTTDSLHAAVVEIVVKEGGRCRYTTIQNWSPNVFNLVTKRAAAYRNATMEWVDGNLGCLAEGSEVMTRSGPKPIELLQPGDEVMSWAEGAGRFVWSAVTAKRFSGRQPVREVRIGERRLRVTDNHPFFSYIHDPTRARKSGRHALGYVRADQVEQAIVPRTTLDYGEPHKLTMPDTETRFETRNQYGNSLDAVRARRQRLKIGETTTDDLMWLFGLFLGDGSIDSAPAANGGRRWAKVVFSVPREDRARARLVEVMRALMPDTRPTERGDGVTLTWNSVELADLFEGNGFVSGVRNKQLPDWVHHLPESQRLSLLAGLLDSDGCAARGRRGFSIKSVSRKLLEDVGRLATTLGIPARIHTESDEERKVTVVGREALSRGSHRIEFPADERLLDHVSKDLRRAVAEQPPATLRWYRRVGRSSIELPEAVEIRKVEVSEPLESVPTWDIEVAGTGNFVAEGFIVHNSRLTMKYPAVYLMEPGAHGEVLSIAFAGSGQHQDAGAKMVHAAPNTTSTIVSKSIAKGGGRAGYRGLVRVEPGAEDSKSFVRCDALILDEESRSDTYPYMEIEENDAEIGHEATVSKVGEEQLFYLMSRGLTEDQATSMIVAGFIEPIVKELPMEYAVEMNRLIELNMAEAGAIG